MIAIGGGVCMDVVGFAASVYRRRTPYVRVPTTLMGYVDASVGAKSGVNFRAKKNKLGSYVPPALSILDASFFATLPRRHLSNGAAEVLKMALVKDAELFHLLHRHGRQLLAQRFQESARADAPSARALRLAIALMLEARRDGPAIARGPAAAPDRGVGARRSSRRICGRTRCAGWSTLATSSRRSSR